MHSFRSGRALTRALHHTFIARTNPKTLRGLARALSESALLYNIIQKHLSQEPARARYGVRVREASLQAQETRLHLSRNGTAASARRTTCRYYPLVEFPHLKVCIVQLLGIIISATCRWRRMAARRHGRLVHSRGRPGGSGTANGTERGGGGGDRG